MVRCSAPRFETRLCTKHAQTQTQARARQQTTTKRKQLDWRLSDEPVGPNTDPEHADPAFRAATRAKIYLGYTSEQRLELRCDVMAAVARAEERWGEGRRGSLQ